MAGDSDSEPVHIRRVTERAECSVEIFSTEGIDPRRQNGRVPHCTETTDQSHDTYGKRAHRGGSRAGLGHDLWRFCFNTPREMTVKLSGSRGIPYDRYVAASN